MSSPEFTFSAFLRLARISDERGQILQRNKFLILAGTAACEAGLLPLAECCRQVVLDDNSAHMLSRFDSFPAALRSTEFQVYLKQLRKFCSTERAEHLLSAQGVATIALTEVESKAILDVM